MNGCTDPGLLCRVSRSAQLPRRLHPPSPLPNSVRHIVATRLSFAPPSSDAAFTLTRSTLHSFCLVHTATFQRSRRYNPYRRPTPLSHECHCKPAAVPCVCAPYIIAIIHLLCRSGGERDSDLDIQTASGQPTTFHDRHQPHDTPKPYTHSMAHHHGNAHLERRQRVDVVVTAFVTAQIEPDFTESAPRPTQEAPKPIRLPPAVSSGVAPPVTHNGGGDGKPTSKPAASRASSAPSSRKVSVPSSARESSDAEETSSAGRLKEATTLMVATATPTPSVASTVVSMTSATASISAAAATGTADAGMSTGAKAGIALGVLLGIGALLIGILLVYRRKKKQMAVSPDNEKTEMSNTYAPPPPQVVVAPASTPSVRTMSTAPRLSVRPVTEFDPVFEQRKSAANLLAVAAAPVAKSQDRELPARPSNSWERPGAAHAPTDNPFTDPKATTANPFGNEAALDTAQANIPNSPPNASPLHSTKPSADFADPASAIAAAAAAPVVAATAVSSASPNHDFPAPPSINTDAVPPSPAWTEDFPASPGPAPTGPPPVAGAAVGARPSSPNSPVDNVHRIQLDFKPSMQDELELTAGQLVRMLHEYDDGWVSLDLDLTSCALLTLHRLSASAWTALSKVSFPVPACPSTPSSLAPALRAKVRLPQVCAALPSARPWAPVAFLSLARSLPPAVATRPPPVLHLAQ